MRAPSCHVQVQSHFASSSSVPTTLPTSPVLVSTPSPPCPLMPVSLQLLSSHAESVR